MKTRIKKQELQNGETNYYAQYKETNEKYLPFFHLWKWYFAFGELDSSRQELVVNLTDSGETPIGTLERAKKIIDLLLEQEDERKAAEKARKVKKTT